MSKNYFPEYEYICNCGCGTSNISKVLLGVLNKAREIAGIPFVLSSGCRCKIHNKIEGGSDTSSHLSDEDIECTAVDIAIHSSHARFKVLEGLIKAGFTRIGIGKDFIHADIDNSKSLEVSWLY